MTLQKKGKMKEAQKLIALIKESQVGVEQPTPGGRGEYSPQYGITGGETPSSRPWKTRIKAIIEQMKKNKN